ncbi:class A beta-lactamase [Methylobacterium sp. Leaf87]|uniref:class A beta-lactamase n=1 Tax=Methylobacterium sp. Leaf87 TaxID=1736243 RepID=UPI000ACB316A|nr:class A beta-lactamase [Methylobacterium sp. Leaf87]
MSRRLGGIDQPPNGARRSTVDDRSVNVHAIDPPVGRRDKSGPVAPGHLLAGRERGLAASMGGTMKPSIHGLSRRKLLFASLAAPFVLGFENAGANATNTLREIERRVGGRLGVSVGKSNAPPLLGHRADERFPMCSTFKVPAAAALMARVDAGTESLDRALPYGEEDLLKYAPVTRKALEAAGGMGRISVADACAAAVEWSDNTAANLMLNVLGGPLALTGWLRGIGDPTTRLDRTEPDLNTAIPDDPRDTTTPDAMRTTLEQILVGTALSRATRTRLDGWLAAGRTGSKRLRAGIPPDWKVGDKTGSGDNGTYNDVAILRPPWQAPILAAVYLTGSTAPITDVDAAYAEIGRMIAEAVRAPRE